MTFLKLTDKDGDPILIAESAIEAVTAPEGGCPRSTKSIVRVRKVEYFIRESVAEIETLLRVVSCKK